MDYIIQYGSGSQHSTCLPKLGVMRARCQSWLMSSPPTYIIEFDVPVHNGRREIVQVGQHRRELLAPTQEVSRG